MASEYLQRQPRIKQAFDSRASLSSGDSWSDSRLQRYASLKQHDHCGKGQTHSNPWRAPWCSWWLSSCCSGLALILEPTSKTEAVQSDLEKRSSNHQNQVCSNGEPASTPYIICKILPNLLFYSARNATVRSFHYDCNHTAKLERECDRSTKYLPVRSTLVSSMEFLEATAASNAVFRLLSFAFCLL
jgi:hypothetical protein